LHLNREQYERFGQRFAGAHANEPMVQIEYQYRRKDGSIFWCYFAGVKMQLQNRDNEDELIRRVDNALYTAKREGRNRVVIA